jgi:uncharacterized protein YcfJ
MNKTQFLITIFVICLSIIITGCATTSGKPVLEENAYYQKVGSHQANHDIKQAIKEAQKDVKAFQKKRQKDLQNIAKETAISSGAGSVVGIITGRTAIGIVTGGGTRAITKVQQQGEDKKAFRQNVEKRLKEKGYQVKRWGKL